MKNILILSTLLFLLFSTTLFGEVNIYPPNLRAPENGNQGQDPDILLDWDAVTGETLNIDYELQLATNADFTDATVFEKTVVTAMQMNDLIFGQTYFWRVMAFDDGSPSDWSVVWTFTVASSVKIKTQPGPPIGGMVYADPEVSWDVLSGLSSYELQIDTIHVFTPDSSGTDETINATFVSETGDKWAVGDDGLVLHFEDMHWVTVDVGTSEDLNDVFFVNDTDGYMVGDGGIIIHYDGINWAINDTATPNNLSGVSFADANTGWFVGDSGLVIKYDGGNWTSEIIADTNDLYDVFALNSTNFWACGKNSMIAHYNGSEWISESVGTKDYFSTWFIDENNGWVVGESGKILYYNGAEWVEQKSGTTKDLYSISFNGSTGYIVGKRSGSIGLLLTYSGEWAPMASAYDDDLFGIYSSGNYTLYGGKDGFLASSNEEGFNSPYLKTYPVPFDSGNYQLANLLFGKTFYYRLRAIHSLDTSQWSGPWSMTTYAFPELKVPGNNSSNTELKQLFRWDEYDGATEYIFQIGTDEEFNAFWTVPLDSNSVNFATPLFDYEYFWRVNALHPEDVSDWSEVWSFTTLSTVTLESPDNNAEDVNSCPKFTWEAIEGVSEYEIVVDLDEGFTNPNTRIVDDNFVQCQEAMEKKTIYYWKVRAITGLDSSDWSAVWSFKTEGYIGIDDNLTKQSVKIYPNPSTGEFSVIVNSLSGEVYKLAVTDIMGKVLMEKDVICFPGENKIDIKLDEAEKGIFLVNVRKSEQVVTKKLFIK